MAVMKQIDKCLTRAFDNKDPLLSNKWKGIFRYDEELGKILYLFHYHHQVLVYLVDHHIFTEEWWEKQADKRGLESAKEWLEDRRRKLSDIS
jgi:hypothetical protein